LFNIKFPYFFLIVSVLFTFCSFVSAEEKKAFVSYVIDGDTIVLKNKEKIRYRAINTPEIAVKDKPGEPFGWEAKKRNEELVKKKRIKLVFGKHSKKRDRYGRLLADVYLEDGSSVSRILLREGLAHLCYGRTDKDFLSAQRQAIDAGKGIWSLPPQKVEKYYIVNTRTMIFHRPDCPFGKKISRKNKAVVKSIKGAYKQGLCPCKRCRP
jgi:endonuclease YncB( thermonuclease family)